MTAVKLVAKEKGNVNNSTGAEIAASFNSVLSDNRSKRAACAGVSFMAQQTRNSSSNVVFRDIGWLTHFFALNGWPWDWSIESNFAVGGITCDLILSDQVPVILASHEENPIDIIFLAMGTNDIPLGRTYEQVIADMDSIITALTDVGIKVFIESIMPRGVDTVLEDYKLQHLQMNKWLEKQSILGRIIYVDITDAMADRTTDFGNALPDLTFDPSQALHPNSKGAKFIGKLVSDHFAGTLLPTITYAGQNADVYDEVNNPTGSLFDNPLLNGGTTKPTGYQGSTWSPVDRELPNGQLKRAWEFALTDGGSANISGTLIKNASGWGEGDKLKEGDVIEGRCRITTENAIGFKNMSFYALENNGSGGIYYKCFDLSVTNESYSLDGSYTYDLKTPKATIRPYSGSGGPSVLFRLDIVCESTGASGKIILENFELRKLI